MKMIRGIRTRNIRREAEMICGSRDRKFASRSFTTANYIVKLNQNMSASRHVAEVFQRGFVFFLEKIIFFRTEDFFF